MNSSSYIKMEVHTNMNTVHWMHQVFHRGSRPHFNLFTIELTKHYNRGFIIVQNVKMGKYLILKITECHKACVEIIDFMGNMKCCANAALPECLSSWHCPWDWTNTTAALTSLPLIFFLWFLRLNRMMKFCANTTFSFLQLHSDLSASVYRSNNK